MKRMLSLLLCAALLLCACGKRQSEPQGSGSAEESTAETGTTAGKKPGKSKCGGKAAQSAAPEMTAPEVSARPAPGGKSGGSRPGGTAAPAATPTPKIETMEDAENVQEQLMPVLAVNPVGNWTDGAGTHMVVDGDFRVSIVQTRSDGTVVVWVFTGTYEPTSGVMTYSDGMKQELTASGMKTVSQNSRGTLTVQNGALVWQDGSEDRTVTFQREDG